MDLLNLSGNYSNFVIPNTGKTEIRAEDVIRDVCTQVDEKILIGLFFILTFWIIVNFIMPISKKSLLMEIPKYKDTINHVFEMGYSLFETLSLMSIAMIIGFGWYQGILTTGFYVWGGVLILFIILSVFIRIRWRSMGLKEE